MWPRVEPGLSGRPHAAAGPLVLLRAVAEPLVLPRAVAEPSARLHVEVAFSVPSPFVVLSRAELPSSVCFLCVPYSHEMASWLRDLRSYVPLPHRRVQVSLRLRSLPPLYQWRPGNELQPWPALLPNP